MDTAAALLRWQMENKVADAVFSTDASEQAALLEARPWKANARYFDTAAVSAIALLKMTVHARKGGDIEVMGLLQGRIDNHRITVLDAFALPVEGTETRVNAQAEGYEYMVAYQTMIAAVGKTENVVGWYHSHPGYGCWLSGIDVATQKLNQQFTDPFLAIVIDPTRTIAAGKVDIGAFRTYPPDYTLQQTKDTSLSIPLNKADDFGVHCNSYYSLNITYFKSSLDSRILEILWKNYWQDTLASSELLKNWDFFGRQVNDLAEKIAVLDYRDYRGGSLKNADPEINALTKVVGDCCNVACQVNHGLISMILKDIVFNKTKATSDHL